MGKEKTSCLPNDCFNVKLSLAKKLRLLSLKTMRSSRYPCDKLNLLAFADKVV